ncbi:MAG TPA: efflux RND transporter periplasmic adaptor subunit [Candidatus Dormibacteraeota bacterium]|nr:efflux RND transporter periplasmic adaptor subunit [Candidatus Dormibacteraeota bacterium]
MRRIAAATAVVIVALLVGVHLGKESRTNAQARKRAESHASFAAQTSVDSTPVTDAPSSSEPAYITVEASMVTPTLESYGQVEPISALPVNAAEKGTVAGLSVLPGMHVRAGQEIAHLSGPAIQLALQQSAADARSAQAQLTADQKILAIEREQLPSHLSTRAAVQQAESAAAQARTNLDNAQSHLQAVRQMMTISAPANGTVLAINASDGQLVSTGLPVVTLQTTARLWLQASYYGADLSLIRVGMTGVFSPANGSAPISVRVRAIFGAMTAGEGEMIGLTPVSSTAQWINGEFGTVTLDQPSRKLVAVPTRSLILDQGKWWVLVHTAQGDHPQQVVPGPTQGWNTFLESGVSVGSQVVVENAYLLFHRGISNTYQPPDQ